MENKKNRSLAIALAFLLGGLGIEWFYVNRPLQGVLSILFFWTFIPCFVALFHVIYWLTINDEKFNKIYV